MSDQPGPQSARRTQPTPTLEDFRAWKAFQGSALTRALDDARAWRNGYALLAGGIATLLGFIGDRLDGDVPWPWRLGLTLTLGLALCLTAVALWLVLTIEGGYRTTTVNLRQVVAEHNSFEMYQADQAACAVNRLAKSRRFAVAAAILGFMGLLLTVWMPTS